MIYRYEITDKDLKKQMVFAAAQTTALFAQVLLCLAISIRLVVFGVIWPLRFTWTEVILEVLLYWFIRLFMTGFLARRYIQALHRSDSGRKDKENSYSCCLDTYGIRFEKVNSESIDMVFYRDIVRIVFRGKSIFLNVDAGEKTRFYIIPASAFLSDADYKEAKIHLKASVKKLQNPRHKKSVFRSWAGGIATVYFDYLKACLKLFLGVVLVFALTVAVMYVATCLKAAH